MKNGKLSGKVAVVTGASKGIGAGVAKHLATEGAAVVVNYASSKESADKVVDEISKRGGKAIAVQGDVAKKKDIEDLFAEAKKAFGKIDIVVNNAGVYEFVPLEEVTEQQFHRMFDTNVLGMLLATQEALKHFNPEGGSIINIGSVVGVSGNAGQTNYAASKAGVVALTKAIGKDLGLTFNFTNVSFDSIIVNLSAGRAILSGIAGEPPPEPKSNHTLGASGTWCAAASGLPKCRPRNPAFRWSLRSSPSRATANRGPGSAN